MDKFKLIHTYETNEEQFNIYKHESGLELIFVKTADENSTFCAKFNTLPKNDHGVPHILEHIALCGSKKYPIDDPFNELVKGTLFTYLNAITYTDKTIYPVSSRNKTEFEKMYKVYLDAVFAPILSKESFLKEGVRQTNTGYSGIVFNEMSSVYNDVESIIGYYTNKELLKGTPYQYDSGGNPESIKETTHEEVLSFYKENYSVSNALLYFYGDLNIEEIFEYISDNYLKEYDANNIKALDNSKFEEKHVKSTVYIDKEMDIYYYSLAFTFDRFNENRFYLDELGILFDYLIESDTSLLTSYLKEKYNLIDISFDFDQETRFPYLSLILKSEEKLENSYDIIDDVKSYLKSEAKKGLNHEELKALISLTNFKVIEENFGYKSKGLSYYLDILNYFIYTNDRSYIHLSKNLDFENLLIKLENNYFENLIVESIVNCKNDVFIEFLQNEEKEEVVAGSSEHYEYDSILPYSDKYIRPISIDNIEKFEEVSFDAYEHNGKTIHFTKNDNKEITFLTLAFEIGENLTDLGILLELIGDSKTVKYDRKHLKMVCDYFIGDLNVSFECINDGSAFKNYVIFEVKLLTKYFDEAINVLLEIINNTKFDDIDANKAKINELILDFNEELISDNARLGLIYAYKDFSKKHFNKNIVEGFTFFDTLKEYKKKENFDFSELNEFLLGSKKLITFIATSNYEVVQKKLNYFVDNIEINYKNVAFKDISQKKSKKIITVDTSTYTNILCGHIDKTMYSGIEEVFSSIVKNEYLSKEIRIKGGAYGYDFSFDYDMNFHMYSVDDPNHSRTIEVFNGVNNYIQNTKFSCEDINRHIIGSVNSYDNFRNFYDKYYLFVLSLLKNTQKNFFVDSKTNMVCANERKIKEFSECFNEKMDFSHILSIGRI